MMIMENPFPIRPIHMVQKLILIRMNEKHAPRVCPGFGDKPQIC